MIIFRQREFTNQSVLRDNLGLIKQIITHLYIVQGRFHPQSDYHHAGELCNWIGDIIKDLRGDKHNKPEKFVKDLICSLSSPRSQQDFKMYGAFRDAIVEEVVGDYGIKGYIVQEETWETSLLLLSEFLICKNENELKNKIQGWIKNLKR